MSSDLDHPEMGGIKEDGNATQNVFRRNLIGAGFQTNLLEAPAFSFDHGSVFKLQSQCLVELALLAPIAVPSINPFELDYMARIKQTSSAGALNAQYLATIEASELPDGATLNATTGILSWRPDLQQGGESFNISFVATGACHPQLVEKLL
jgi:hypothetical protein